MATAIAKPVSTAKKKKKITQSVPKGHAYISASYNNTIVTITDLHGNVLGWASAGMSGFKGPKKATPYAASMIVKKVVESLEAYGLKEVQVFVKGIGQGREGAIRAFHANNIEVTSIKDVTPIPHNGCRARKKRRV